MVGTPASLYDKQGNPLLIPASDTYSPSALAARDYVFPWTGSVTSQLVLDGPQVDPPYGGLAFSASFGSYGWKMSVTALLKYMVSINQSSTATPQIISAARFEEMIATQAYAYQVPACQNNAEPEVTTLAGPTYGLGFESYSFSDACKTGSIPGGGGILTLSNVYNDYDYTNHDCPSCVTWAVLVNTEGGIGGGWPGWPGAGSEYNPAGYITNAVQYALGMKPIQAALDDQTNTDLFPTYLGSAP
jgi:hypothetical protein